MGVERYIDTTDELIRKIGTLHIGLEVHLGQEPVKKIKELIGRPDYSYPRVVGLLKKVPEIGKVDNADVLVEKLKKFLPEEDKDHLIERWEKIFKVTPHEEIIRWAKEVSESGKYFGTVLRDLIRGLTGIEKLEVDHAYDVIGVVSDIAKVSSIDEMIEVIRKKLEEGRRVQPPKAEIPVKPFKEIAKESTNTFEIIRRRLSEKGQEVSPDELKKLLEKLGITGLDKVFDTGPIVNKIYAELVKQESLKEREKLKKMLP